MRKTLLGKATIHGTSAIAAGIIAGSQLTRHLRQSSEKPLTEEEEQMAKKRHKSMRNMRLDPNLDHAVQTKLGLLEEELQAVRNDLTLAGLNFGQVS